MTGDSATFADALHFGRFSTAWLWIGPSLDWQTQKSEVMAFLWCNSLFSDKVSDIHFYLCKAPVLIRIVPNTEYHETPQFRTL